MSVSVCVGWWVKRGLTLTKQAPSVTHEAAVVRDTLPLLTVEPTLHSSAPGVEQEGEGEREEKRINSDRKVQCIHKEAKKLYRLPTITNLINKTKVCYHSQIN